MEWASRWNGIVDEVARQHIRAIPSSMQDTLDALDQHQSLWQPKLQALKKFYLLLAADGYEDTTASGTSSNVLENVTIDDTDWGTVVGHFWASSMILSFPGMDLQPDSRSWRHPASMYVRPTLAFIVQLVRKTLPALCEPFAKVSNDLAVPSWPSAMASGHRLYSFTPWRRWWQNSIWEAFGGRAISPVHVSEPAKTGTGFVLYTFLWTKQSLIDIIIYYISYICVFSLSIPSLLHFNYKVRLRNPRGVAFLFRNLKRLRRFVMFFVLLTFSSYCFFSLCAGLRCRGKDRITAG